MVRKKAPIKQLLGLYPGFTQSRQQPIVAAVVEGHPDALDAKPHN
jgi:hypothetical protein